MTQQVFPAFFQWFKYPGFNLTTNIRNVAKKDGLMERDSVGYI